MPGKVRVHELAKELNVSSKQVISKLNETGHFVKSASSLIDSAVAAKVRTALASQPKIIEQRSGSAPMSRAGMKQNSLYRASPPKASRKTYRSPDMGPLTKMILDEVVVQRRGPRDHYFADEVAAANQLTKQWAGVLFTMPIDEIAEWIRVGDRSDRFQSTKLITADQAVALHEAGIKPADLNRLGDSPPLGLRLAWGNISVEAVVADLSVRCSLEVLTRHRQLRHP